MTTFSCECGHKWQAVPNNVLHNSGCPQCARHGFKTHISAYFYVFRRNNYIKYGITNDLEKRIKQHETNGKLDLVFTKFYEHGNEALSVENHIKQTFGGQFATREQCPDGFTETLCETKLSNLIKSIL